MIYYSNTHEWINDITGEFGLSQHALDLLGDLVYLEVPFPGALVQQLDEIGVIESVKAASDIFSPVTGKVIWTNEEAIEMFDLDPAVLLDEMMNEAEGKGCAESEGGPGCIKKKQGDQRVIMNNKKGGVWRKCDSEAHCEEILDAFHASKG